MSNSSHSRECLLYYVLLPPVPVTSVELLFGGYMTPVMQLMALTLVFLLSLWQYHSHAPQVDAVKND